MPSTRPATSPPAMLSTRPRARPARSGRSASVSTADRRVRRSLAATSSWAIWVASDARRPPRSLAAVARRAPELGQDRVDLLVQLRRCGRRPPPRRTRWRSPAPPRASRPAAVIATMLLWRPARRVTLSSSSRGLSSECRAPPATRSATSMVVASCAAVSTSRVGSDDSRIRPRLREQRVLAPGPGVTSRSASAS